MKRSKNNHPNLTGDTGQHGSPESAEDALSEREGSQARRRKDFQ